MNDQPQKRPGLSNPAVLLATWFGAGYLPKAPGTWGSLAALPFAWLIHGQFGWPGLALATVGVFFIGIWCSTVYIGLSGADDPGPVVIDEVAGQWLVLIAVTPEPLLYALGFVFFRIADITKPWPASWADKTVKGGFGVMLDDILAAIYAGLLLFGVSYWMKMP